MAQPLQVKRSDVVRGLVELGIRRGSLVMVHSSLSAIGRVDGGPDAVVDAFLDVIGPDGTLVVPTFTYPADCPAARDPDWIFDPAETPSGMGAISDAVRRRPQARRSIHLWHSVAAIGPLADRITSAGGPSAWDSQSPMAWTFRNGGWLLLLGVSYQSLTAIHIWEVAFEVDYRHDYDVERRMRGSDGRVIPLVSRVHDRVEGHLGSDFNRFGRRLEDAGLVQIGHVGNAVARFFSSRDAYEMAQVMYREDKCVFLKKMEGFTSLAYGRAIQNAKGSQCVVDPALVFATPST